VVVRRHVWVSGRVQGVWFRQSCAELADRLGVSGWIRNLPDWRVEAVFEGDDAAVDEIVAWCHHGPLRAMVTDVEVVAEDAEGSKGFLVV
jgi:acylphosphatase